jgi:quercetin dioxygenase-like cupin family protein
MMRLLYYNLLIKAIEKQGGSQMTEKFIKNIKHEEIVMLSDLVQANEGQIVSKTLAQNEALSITLFAFDKGEEISSHESNGDAMVTVLEGTGKFTVDGKEYLLNAGETLIMPAKKPHAVYAEERFKMELVVVF